MARKRHKPEESVAKLRQVDVSTSQEMPISDAIRSIGATQGTCYRAKTRARCGLAMNTPRLVVRTMLSVCV